MPYKRIELSEGASDYPEALANYKDGERPIYRVLLWPHRSLSRGGFVTFIAITSALLCMPLLPLIGTPVIWGLLPFLVGAVALTWYFIMRSYRDGHLVEELSLWPDHMALVRMNPHGPKEARRQDWAANPYWVEINSHDTPVPNYLTLRGGTREVELGSFLTPDERLSLKDELETQLRSLSPDHDMQ